VWSLLEDGSYSHCKDYKAIDGYDNKLYLRFDVRQDKTQIANSNYGQCGGVTQIATYGRTSRTKVAYIKYVCHGKECYLHNKVAR
jgi:hypothetical protein